jgi:Bacterial Ig-like domain (group 3)
MLLAAALTLLTLLVAGVLAAPAMADFPTVQGTPRQGSTLTISDPDDPNQPPTLIQWSQCDSSGNNCQTILNQTGTSYLPTAADVGFTIAVSDDEGGPSAATQVVFPVLLAPVIAGSTAEGQTLQAVPAWSVEPAPAGASFGFTWSRCNPGCSDIPGASGPQYQLTSADVGSTIQVGVSDTEPSGASQGPVFATTSSSVAPAGAASVTSIVTSPSSAVTNQLVTLIATVTSTNSSKAPTGTVAFANRGAVIPGCGAIPASTFGQSVTVTCTAAFTAANSPEQLTAAFTPSVLSPVSGSGSTPLSLTIRKGSTSSSVDVSNPTVGLGSNETYTANVQASLGGSAKPSGTAEFFDHGQPIATCTKRPLTTTSAGSQASCVVRYPSPGSHSVAVSYPGDPNYLGSGSQAATQVTARSISLGVVTSTMQWSFRLTRSYTRVLGLLINSVSAGTHILVRCHGPGCPFAKRATTLDLTIRCSANGKAKGKAKCVTQRSRNIDLASGFRGRRLHNGALIRIYLTRPQWIGKYYQFTIRAGAPPRIRIACLAPGSTAPGVGC